MSRKEDTTLLLVSLLSTLERAGDDTPGLANVGWVAVRHTHTRTQTHTHTHSHVWKLQRGRWRKAVKRECLIFKFYNYWQFSSWCYESGRLCVIFIQTCILKMNLMKHDEHTEHTVTT
jgi:hypothetical protein